MEALDLILRIFGIAAAVAVLWRAVRLLIRIEDSLPTLLGIADQFKPNAGKSLYDHLDRADKRLGVVEGSIREIQRDLESVLIERPRHPNTVRAEFDEPNGTPI